jgi:uncharacterized RDD family membrane protein YckC
METRSTYEKWLDNIGDRESHREMGERGPSRSMTRFRGMPLASRVSRLAAAIIDTLLILGAMVPGIICLLVANVSLKGAQLRPTDLTLAIVALALLALLPLPLALFQIVLITRDGQTIGKRLLGIRMVKSDEEWVPGFVDGWLLRSFVFNVIALVPSFFLPGSGGIFALIDVLFIFRDDRRCLHDLVAGTKVIQSAAWVD